MNIVDDLYYLSIIHLETADGAHCQYCEWSQSQNSVSLSWSSLNLLNPQQTPWLWYTLAQSQVGISKSQLQGITLAYLKDRTCSPSDLGIWVSEEWWQLELRLSCYWAPRTHIRLSGTLCISSSRDLTTSSDLGDTDLVYSHTDHPMHINQPLLFFEDGEGCMESPVIFSLLYKPGFFHKMLCPLLGPSGQCVSQTQGKTTTTGVILRHKDNDT